MHAAKSALTAAAAVVGFEEAFRPPHSPPLAVLHCAPQSVVRKGLPRTTSPRQPLRRFACPTALLNQRCCTGHRVRHHHDNHYDACLPHCAPQSVVLHGPPLTTSPRYACCQIVAAFSPQHSPSLAAGVASTAASSTVVVLDEGAFRLLLAFPLAADNRLCLLIRL